MERVHGLLSVLDGHHYNNGYKSNDSDNCDDQQNKQNY